MGAAGYNRGSMVLSRDVDRAMPATSLRAELDAHNDEMSRLRTRVAELEQQLRRARRCLSAERYSREQRAAECRADISSSQLAISILCRIAFRGEKGGVDGL